ncbi:uncharacterized protein EI97DRAFT_129374 [Westerdykella ornata]|uniref:Uncharacterized protein n=1 Tax=Westerdykella ornata TaxID=318751 RepID=A0A6A6JE09_WESOR|nr:uncharacterized protein EI97DRAFT_129374 [Westerdykella ornata]KAF2274444.1 hypothetical protein EI97DRAFT_129374 [Westerdykella ornata]
MSRLVRAKPPRRTLPHPRGHLFVRSKIILEAKTTKGAKITLLILEWRNRWLLTSGLCSGLDYHVICHLPSITCQLFSPTKISVSYEDNVLYISQLHNMRLSCTALQQFQSRELAAFDVVSRFNGITVLPYECSASTGLAINSFSCYVCHTWRGWVSVPTTTSGAT